MVEFKQTTIRASNLGLSPGSFEKYFPSVKNLLRKQLNQNKISHKVARINKITLLDNEKDLLIFEFELSGLEPMTDYNPKIDAVYSVVIKNGNKATVIPGKVNK
ncbi:hypothetical protein [Anabaena sp. UHCC 0253]|uniref:hypothetical protein n=1 Tax=Anabaena sp. UHCC 0253 TaxID=2590019 RepID=UPI0014467148|nr:hypothetical protein [Anabaena sp. UHCC 0253]